MSQTTPALHQCPEQLGQIGVERQKDHPLGSAQNGQTLGGWAYWVKTILVPIDFSPAAGEAVECAAGIANHCGAQVTLLHVIDINQQACCGTAHDLMETLWTEGSSRLGQLAWALSNQVDAQTMLAEGLPWEVIVEQSQRFDLVVLAQTRAKGDRKLFSHQTRQRVLENCGCPVMVIPTLH